MPCRASGEHVNDATRAATDEICHAARNIIQVTSDVEKYVLKRFPMTDPPYEDIDSYPARRARSPQRAATLPPARVATGVDEGCQTNRASMAALTGRVSQARGSRVSTAAAQRGNEELYASVQRSSVLRADLGEPEWQQQGGNRSSMILDGENGGGAGGGTSAAPVSERFESAHGDDIGSDAASHLSAAQISGEVQQAADSATDGGAMWAEAPQRGSAQVQMPRDVLDMAPSRGSFIARPQQPARGSMVASMAGSDAGRLSALTQRVSDMLGKDRTSQLFGQKQPLSDRKASASFDGQAQGQGSLQGSEQGMAQRNSRLSSALAFGGNAE